MAAGKHRDKKINPNTVRNILTLRYDPLQKPLLPKLNWTNFIENKENPSLEILEKLIEKTIKTQTKNAKNIAIALSGGIDSTIVLTYIRKVLPEIKIDAISIKFADSLDETKSAARIAEHFNTNHHIVELDNYLKELPKAISIIKLPFWDLHWYYVVKKAQTLSKYLASGDGGDEIFGGYTFRYKKFLELTNNHSSPLEKVKVYLECHERDRVPDQDKLFGQKCKFSWDLIYDILIPYFDNNLSRLDQVLLADYNGKLLYNFSPVNTALHNYFEIDAVSPLLSPKLISYVTPLSNKFKYDQQNNIGKIMLRHLLKIHKAESLITEEKLGFNVNTINLWKSHGKRLCKHYLSNPRIAEDGWISKTWINQYIDKSKLNVKYVNKFLGLLAFEIWYRLFVTKEMKSNTILD